MKNQRDQDFAYKQPRHERLKVILMSFFWLVFFALSFLSYYAIPAVILVSWVIIAWFIKACKGDKPTGSGYDRDF